MALNTCTGIMFLFKRILFSKCPAGIKQLILEGHWSNSPLCNQKSY